MKSHPSDLLYSQYEEFLNTVHSMANTIQSGHFKSAVSWARVASVDLDKLIRALREKSREIPV